MASFPLMRHFWTLVSLIWMACWIFSLRWTILAIENSTYSTTQRFQNQLGNQDIPRDEIMQQQHNHDDTTIAKEIIGIELQIPSPIPGQDAIQVVFASSTATDNLSAISASKGLVLLLHACSHSALKFFSPSPQCPGCVGLSEELRIVRLVLERGYTPVAISCIDQRRRCWSEPRDIPRIQHVFKHSLFANYQRSNGRVFSIGASSGGAFAANLVNRQMAQAAVVMVMSLSNEEVTKLKNNPKPIYFAPMPRDKATMKRVIQNYQDLHNIANSNGNSKQKVILDTQTCDSLPVTPSYLIQRVPHMTEEAAISLVSKLKSAGHISLSSNMMNIDPTTSNWRDIISPTNSTHWLGQFALKPGYSSLAKALHRAWAFHEYCSEVIVPALAFFEQQLE